MSESNNQTYQMRRSVRRSSPGSRISIGARSIAVPSGGHVSALPIGLWSPPGSRFRSPSAAPPRLAGHLGAALTRRPSTLR
jgi:hypothetical protein